MNLTFRDKIGEGGLLVGLAAYVMRSVDIVTIAGGCGFDWLLVDTEHTPIGFGEVAAIATAAATAGFPALVRVGGAADPHLARALDCGAVGLVVPHVDSLAEARTVVARARFAPVGRRSIPGPQPSLAYHGVPVPTMIEAVEAQTALVLMIESPEGLAAADAIAALDGVDALMIGANDLACSLGHVGDVAHREVRAACAAVAECCRRHGKAYGVIGLGEDTIASHGIDLGATLVVATNDINLMMESGAALARRLKGLVSGHPASDLR